MERRHFLFTSLAGVLATPHGAIAQSAGPYRVGLVHHGGSYDQASVGLRDGLTQLGSQEGQQYLVHMRDAHGDLEVVREAAAGLEAEKVDLICAFSTSTAVRVKQATKRVPIVFHAGTDPVKIGLVESFRKPGGRLTGLY